MPLFRKKPVVISAEQFLKHSSRRPDGIIIKNDTPVIETLEGDMKVSHGDWIITGVNGEKYPCKHDIFLKTYEPVE